VYEANLYDWLLRQLWKLEYVTLIGHTLQLASPWC